LVDFTEVLNKKSDDLKKPVPRPAGTYLGMVVGLPMQKVVTPKAGGDDMPVASYKIKLLSAMEDVDQTELASQPPIGDWGVLNRTQDFFLHTEGGQYYHSKWLEDVLGIPPEDKTVGERMAEAPGRQLIVKLKHVPFVNKAGEAEIGTDIESTAHV
jgi:hypothetical protein